jgi:hypothetical protein
MSTFEDRTETLRTLIDLAQAPDPASCWDRAAEILRCQSTAEELRRLGAEPRLIAELWPGEQIA